MMRLFIALPVSENIRKPIQAGIKKARSFGADMKWVKEDNLHLTIKFLGDQPETLVPALIAGLEQAAQGSSGFSLGCAEIGYFPNRNHPRVIWLGLGGQVSAADQLAERVDKRLEILGIMPEKRRRWHLTLGRVRSDRNLENLLPQLQPLFRPLAGAKWDIRNFSLYQSTLTPGGPIYKELHKFQLA